MSISSIARKLFIGGNWKCNNTLSQTKELVEKVINQLKFDDKKAEVIVSPVFIHIPYVMSAIKNKVQVAAQNASATAFGAYTGEIAPQQLKDLGINWAILGHSERRQYYGENDEIVAQKTKLALANKLSVILCCGETFAERESNSTLKVIHRQLNAVKAQLTLDDWYKIVIAYEPVWAIGTGKVATTGQAEEVHASIRAWLGSEFSKEVQNKTRVIYGGSVTEKNCDELIKQSNIDGFLVGGASLKSTFIPIVESTNKK